VRPQGRQKPLIPCDATTFSHRQKDPPWLRVIRESHVPPGPPGSHDVRRAGGQPDRQPSHGRHGGQCDHRERQGGLGLDAIYAAADVAEAVSGLRRHAHGVRQPGTGRAHRYDQ
jgi:hypothetical protein